MQPDVESGKEEKMEVIRIDDNSWRIEDEGVRFFLLTGDEKALLVDSGMTISNAKEIAEGLTSLPISLVNTHADPDHIGSNDEFDFFYIHPAEAVNYYNVQKRNGNFIPVEDGYIFNLGNRKLRVISIPGHTPGSIVLLDEERRILISGDPAQDGDIYMFGIMREFHAYIESLKKLDGMKDSFDEILPSHGTFPISPSIIPELIENAGKCLNGELMSEEINIRGMRIKRTDATVAHFLCDM